MPLNALAVFAMKLEDIYVIPELRMAGKSRELVGAVEAAAAKLGYKEITANVATAALNSTDSLKAALAVGFTLVASDANLIYLSKPIKGI